MWTSNFNSGDEYSMTVLEGVCDGTGRSVYWHLYRPSCHCKKHFNIVGIPWQDIWFDLLLVPYGAKNTRAHTSIICVNGESTVCERMVNQELHCASRWLSKFGLTIWWTILDCNNIYWTLKNQDGRQSRHKITDIRVNVMLPLLSSPLLLLLYALTYICKWEYIQIQR